jgi:hypothetical protein
MGDGSFSSLDLDKALGTDGLLAATRGIDIGGVVLDIRICADEMGLDSQRTRKQIGHSTAPIYAFLSLFSLS